MPIWERIIDAENFEFLREGKKKVEACIPNPANPAEDYKKIAEGNLMRFKCRETGKILNRKILSCRYYKTLENFCIEEGIERISPKSKTLGDLIRDLYKNNKETYKFIEFRGLYAVTLKDANSPPESNK